MVAQSPKIAQSGHTGQKWPLFQIRCNHFPTVKICLLRAKQDRLLLFYINGIIGSSVTRWLDYFFIFGHLQLIKNWQTAFKICQIWFKLLPNTKLSIENCQKTFTLSQSGEILPNLVTLIGSYLVHWALLWKEMKACISPNNYLPCLCNANSTETDYERQ